MSAEVLPFPSYRRRPTVKRLAAQMRPFGQEAAQNVLAARVKRLIVMHESKGNPRPQIDDDVKRFAAAVHVEVMLPNSRPSGGRA